MAVKDKLISNEALKPVYDNLNGKVGDLKSAMNSDVDVINAGNSFTDNVDINPLLVYQNAAVTKNGDNTWYYNSNANRISSNRIGVDAFSDKVIIYVDSTDYYFIYYCVDSSNKIIAQGSYTNNTSTTNSYTLASGTKYIILGMRNAVSSDPISPSASSHLHVKVNAKVKTETDAIKANVTDLFDRVDVVYNNENFGWQNGYYKLNNGSWLSGTYYTSKALPFNYIPKQIVNDAIFASDTSRNVLSLWNGTTYAGYYINGILYLPNGNVTTSLTFTKLYIMIYGSNDYTKVKVEGVFKQIEDVPDFVKKTTEFSDYPSTIYTTIRKNAGYVKLDGSIGTSDLDHWVYSDHVPCNEGLVVSYKLFGATNVASISFYDATNNIMTAYSVVAEANNTVISGTVTAPSGAVSFVVCNFYQSLANGYASYPGYMTLNDVVMEVKTLSENPASDWNGKSAALKGDSITVGTYTPAGGGEMTTTDSYIVRAMTALGISYTNYAVNGICISSQGTSTHPERAICLTYANMSNDVDLVIIAAGTNDYGTDVPLGTIADTTDISFYGAMDVLCNGLSTKYADKTVIFITPLNRVNENTANNVGKVLQDYRDAMVDVCHKYGFNYIDGTRMGVHAPNATYASTHIYDGTHPNPITHETMGETLKKMLMGM